MAAAPFGALRFGRYWRTTPVKREQGLGHTADHHALAAPATVCRPPPHASRTTRLPPLDFFCASPRDARQTVWEGGVWVHGYIHGSPASPETGPPITFSPAACSRAGYNCLRGVDSSQSHRPCLQDTAHACAAVPSGGFSFLKTCAHYLLLFLR